MKLLALPFLLFGISFSSLNNQSEPEIKIIRDNSAFVLNEYEVGKYEITGVKEEYQNSFELRVYSREISNVSITRICDSAFDNCVHLSSIMLSSDVKEIATNVFSNLSNLEYVNFTGSDEQYASLNIDSSINYVTYANDEGFIHYWNDYIRMEDNTNLCDIQKDIYLTMKDKYDLLSSQEKTFVNQSIDRAGIQIKSSIDYLDEYFKEKPSNPSTKREMNKSTAIALIVTASIIGMTSISLFFFLKTKNIID